MPVQTSDSLPQILKCIGSRSVGIVEPKIIKEAWLILHGSKQCMMKLHQFDRPTSLGTSRTTILQDDYKAKSGMGRGFDFEESFAPVARWKQFGIFIDYAATQGFSISICYGRETAIYKNGPLKEEVYLLSRRRVCLIQIIQKKSTLLKKALLWDYSKLKSLDSGFELTAFSDALIFADALIPRKNTSGGIQFLGGKLCKLDVKEIKTALQCLQQRREYVALSASLCSRTGLIHYAVKNHKLIAVIEQRHHDPVNTMAEQNVPAQAPTRTDEQIDEKTGVYCCQVDEQWFNLSADLLRKALDITPVDPTHPFELPPTGDTMIDFVNQLGYPEPVEFVSNIRVNYVYQPWRAILTLINQCLTGKTSGGDKPRHPVLQMLWGIVTQTNVDHAELLWEEFTQGIQTFFSHKASHKASLKDPKKKAVPLLIPYGRFTKMIIYYLGSTSDVHKRPESPCHLPGDDFLLGNLKFISKGETDEVFGMNTKKTLQESASKQSEHGTRRAPPSMHHPKSPLQSNQPSQHLSSKQTTFIQILVSIKKPSKITPSRKVRKGKPSLVDEEDEAQQEPESQGEGDDPALNLAKKLSLMRIKKKEKVKSADA
ncbi:hypothetical protein Tco_0738159 [Tanacetum coccineum]